MTVEITTTPEQDAAEAVRDCSGCGANVVSANVPPAHDDGDPTFVCRDRHDPSGYLHPGECCICFDRREYAR